MIQDSSMSGECGEIENENDIKKEKKDFSVEMKELVSGMGQIPLL